MGKPRQLWKQKKGMALLLVLCLFAMLTAFGASLLLAANTATQGSLDSFRTEQARLSAQSVCDIIRSELTKTETTTLKEKINSLTTGSSLPLTVTLPEANMGTVTGEVSRPIDNRIVVKITADNRGHLVTLKMQMNRVDGEDGAVTWSFSGYKQNLPPSPVSETTP